MTYQPDFSSCWAKLDRAKEHRDVLGRETDVAFGIEANRVGLRVEYDTESGYHVFRATTFPPEDLLVRFGLIMGDALQNLRSALDHLVWQLSLFRRNGREPRNPRTVQFPIVKDPIPNVRPEDFMGGKKEALWDVLPEHRAIIEDHQPYKRWYNFPIPHPFLRLQRLSNDDKHRLVNPVLFRSASIFINPDVFRNHGGKVVGDRGAYFGQPLIADAEVLQLKIWPSSLQRNMQVAGNVVPLICFPDVPHSVDVSSIRKPKPAEVTIALDAIGAYVVQVIREFEPLF
jgi:hypothetical protein